MKIRSGVLCTAAVTVGFVASLGAATPAQAQQMKRASLTSNGKEGSGFSNQTQMSPDGRFVVFTSSSDDLVPGDLNESNDIFLHDMITGETERVSVGPFFLEGDKDSANAAISADGRFVVFESAATNLVSGDTNGVTDIFVRDRQKNKTSLVSQKADGTQGDGASRRPSITADGRFIVFHSDAKNLVGGDLNSKTDIFRHDQTTKELVLISVNSGGVNSADGRNQFEAAGGPRISADGNRVVFQSDARNILRNFTNGTKQVYLRDIALGRTAMISVNLGGGEGNDISKNGTISASGSVVAFLSRATDLINGDSNAARDVFLRFPDSGFTLLISRASGANGEQGDKQSKECSISADGNYVAFTSDATNLVKDDNNGHGDVFLRDLNANTTTRVSVSNDGTEGNGFSGPSLFCGGDLVCFESRASNLVVGDTNGLADVFVHNPNAKYKVSTSVLFAGSLGLFSVEEATPNQMQFLVFTFAGFGNTPVPQLGVTVALKNPTLGFQGKADENGEIEWSTTIPIGQLGNTVFIQVIEQGRTTTALSTTIL